MSRDVFGCYLYGDTVEQSFTSSLARLLERDKLIIDRQMWIKHAPSGGIFTGRNELTRRFLASTAEWMWMVDADMGFEPDALSRLRITALTQEVTMAGALCFSWPIVRRDGMGGDFRRPQPTIYGHDGIGFRAVTDYKRDTVLPAAGTGAAFLLLHRHAVEAVKREHGEDWWTPVRDGQSGEYLGEDLSFFLRANSAGHRLVVDTSIKTTHAKKIHLSEEHFAFWPREEPC